jgi:2-C-methyl-D-erythritol 4-phosphate cytidylyltransferase
METFAAHPSIGPLVLVLHPDDLHSDLWPRSPTAIVVTGGETRSQSVLAGLRALAGQADLALIHDAARPCVSAAVIDGVLRALEGAQAAAPALPVVDALWTGKDGHVTGLAARDGLFRAQTPQGFRLDAIVAAHEAATGAAADDVEIALRAGLEVVITAGSEDNLKITHPADFERAERIMKARHGHQTG